MNRHDFLVLYLCVGNLVSEYLLLSKFLREKCLWQFSFAGTYFCRSLEKSQKSQKLEFTKNSCHTVLQKNRRLPTVFCDFWLAIGQKGPFALQNHMLFFFAVCLRKGLAFELSQSFHLFLGCKRSRKFSCSKTRLNFKKFDLLSRCSKISQQQQ